MKALSVQQPWAWALFHGKPVENRDRSSSHRGPLMIHASKTFDDEGMAWILLNRDKLGLSLDDFPKRMEDFPRGGFVGIVNMWDCVLHYDSLWFFGPRGWLFEKSRQLEKIVLSRGWPGLFDVPRTALAEALRQLKACPLCGSSLIYANIGNGTIDTYCEECGFPDENRLDAG